MKKTIFVLAMLVSSFSLLAQVTEKEGMLKTEKADTILGWKKGGTLNLNFSQASLTNWAAGGENSIAFLGLLNAFANRIYKNASWDNLLDLGYGIQRNGDKHVPFRKGDDRMELMSKYGQRASEHWFYAALVSFKTQMSPGYNYPNDSVMISDFMAPAYLIGAIGMDFKPNDDFTCFLAPLTGKVIIVNSTNLANAGACGVDPAEYDSLGNVTKAGKKTKYEFGGYVRIAYRKDIMKNVTLSTKADFFSNYLKNPQNIVVNWETLISMKVNKYISATLSTMLIYDDQVMIKDGDAYGPRTQFKELFGAGFSYKF